MSYKNTLIFGNFVKKRKHIRCTLTNMLLTGSLMVNGHINENMLHKVTKGELWVYLYYIWGGNRFSEVFSEHTTPGNKMDYKSLMKLVRNISQSKEPFFFKKDIMMCCNTIINMRDINIPIIEEILEAMTRAFIKQEEDLKKSIEKYELWGDR